jgi:hypothetical protein
MPTISTEARLRGHLAASRFLLGRAGLLGVVTVRGEDAPSRSVSVLAQTAVRAPADAGLTRQPRAREEPGDDGTIGIASYRPWLRWLDYPTLDRHHLIAVTYDAQANGLPAGGAARCAAHRRGRCS